MKFIQCFTLKISPHISTYRHTDGRHHYRLTFCLSYGTREM